MKSPGPRNPSEIVVTARIAEIERFGHAVLDLTVGDFLNAGFSLGDLITVSAGSFQADMPFLNGYYVESGEYMVRAFPGDTHIAICLNYGRFDEAAEVAPGDSVTIRMKEKAGALALQESSGLVASRSRADYASDEEFANFRAIVPGRLYRSASPLQNPAADSLIRKAGIRAVMNLADSEETLREALSGEETEAPYYRELFRGGNIIPLCMPVNFSADAFGRGIVKGFSFLMEKEGPYLIHCLKGKDRAAFAAMLPEMLIGLDRENILADYMLSYTNYYKVQPGSEKHSRIMEREAIVMMRVIAGLGKGASLDGIDWQAAAAQYLTGHGMSRSGVEALKKYLTV